MDRRKNYFVRKGPLGIAELVVMKQQEKRPRLKVLYKGLKSLALLKT